MVESFRLDEGGPWEGSRDEDQTRDKERVLAGVDA